MNHDGKPLLTDAQLVRLKGRTCRSPNKSYEASFRPPRRPHANHTTGIYRRQSPRADGLSTQRKPWAASGNHSLLHRDNVPGEEDLSKNIAAKFTQNWRRKLQSITKLPELSVAQKNIRREAIKPRTRIERHDVVSQAKPNHLASEISAIHGFLRQQDVHELIHSTNYTERELYKLFNRFKALAALSSTPTGIDKDTFRRGVPMLSVEDNLFVDRVFEVLDEDGSGIIDWNEFVEAMSSLEKGSREKRTDFLFRVYDIDKDGGITRDELGQFFLSSLMVEVDDTIREVSDYFVQQVFEEIDLDKNGSMTVEEAIRYIRQHPEAKDIFGMFGRSMASEDAGDAGDFLSQKRHQDKKLGVKSGDDDDD